MGNAINGILFYEASQDDFPMTELTNQGDNKEFKSTAQIWSRFSGKTPNVKPNGLATGGVISPAASGNDDQIDISISSCYLVGVLTQVPVVSDKALTRATASNTHKKMSVTITNAGTIAIVDGAEGTSFSDTRGAAGGPPWIPTTSIEIGIVQLDAQASAKIIPNEIKQVENVSLERFNAPVWTEQVVDVQNGVMGYAGVTFTSALPLIHSDDSGTNTATKKVFASYSTPSFAEAIDAYDFVPPANSHSVNTTEVYGRVKGSVSRTINQGTFSMHLQDGISDNILKFVDQILWFKFKSDRLATPYILTQGVFGNTRNFPAGGEDVNAACTINSDITAQNITA